MSNIIKRKPLAANILSRKSNMYRRSFINPLAVYRFKKLFILMISSFAKNQHHGEQLVQRS